MSKTSHLVWQGVEYRILLDPEQSGGALSLFETLEHPGYGPPRHIHAREDETFYVLAGEVEFWLDGARFRKGPGDVISVAGGREHTFRVIGDHPARMLTIMTPGGFEGFFRDMAAGQYRIPEDMAKVAEIGATYHLTFTGPPLAA